MKVSSRFQIFQIPILALLVGFLIMVYEVYAIKKIFFYYAENTYSVSVALSSFLAGLGLSGIICSRFVHKKPQYLKETLSILIFSFSLYGILVLSQTSLIPLGIDLFTSPAYSSGFNGLMKGLFLWFYLFLPAFLIGGAFPLLISSNIDERGQPYLSGGTIYFLDIIGGAFGALITGIFFIPNMGMQFTCLIMGVVGSIALIVLRFRSSYPYIVLVVALIWHFPSSDIQQRQSVFQEAVFNLSAGKNEKLDDQPVFNNVGKLKRIKAERVEPYLSKYIAYNDSFGDVIFQEPSSYGIVTVGRKESGEGLGLFINYRDMCWSDDNESEKTLGKLTAENLDSQAIVLNIGLGCGFTAQSLATSPRVAELTIVEINPVVIEACKTYFSDVNGKVLKNQKVTLLLDNGAEVIRKSKNNVYDAIVVDIEEPGVIQSSPIYTVEYAKIIKQKLKPEGIFSLWAIMGTEKYNEILFYTLSEVFRFVYFRADAGNTQLYAASRSLDLDDETPESWRNRPPKDRLINTFENRALEKSYSIEDAFNIPDGYKDPFVRAN